MGWRFSLFSGPTGSLPASSMTRNVGSVLPRDSFYAVVFDTTKHRDKAISDLKRVTLKVDGVAGSEIR